MRALEHLDALHQSSITLSYVCCGRCSCVDDVDHRQATLPVWLTYRWLPAYIITIKGKVALNDCLSASKKLWRTGEMQPLDDETNDARKYELYAKCGHRYSKLQLYRFDVKV